MTISRWKVMAGVLGVSLGGLAAVAGPCQKPDLGRTARSDDRLKLPEPPKVAAGGSAPAPKPVAPAPLDVPPPSSVALPLPSLPPAPPVAIEAYASTPLPAADKVPLSPPGSVVLPASTLPPAPPPSLPDVGKPTKPAATEFPAPPAIKPVGIEPVAPLPTQEPLKSTASVTTPVVAPPAAVGTPPAPVVAPPASVGMPPAPVNVPPAVLITSQPAPATAAPPAAVEHGGLDPLVLPDRTPAAPAAKPAVVTPVAAVVPQTKFKIILRVGEGEPMFEVRHGDDLVMKVACEKVDIKSPEKGQGLSAVTATGKVRFVGFGAEGTCENFSFLAGTGEVLMSGNVKLQVKDKIGRVESELTTDKMQYKLDASSLPGTLKP